LFGAWVRPVGGWGADAEERGITQLQLHLGRKLALDEVYVTWAEPMPLSIVRWDRSQGTETLISWAGTNTAALADGAYDPQIRARAIQLRDLRQPVMLRWFPEMDGAANQPRALSPTSFIAAWRHIHDIFDGVGADNVEWVWCPTAAGFATGTAQKFYPGREYVNWVCADGYNWAPRLSHASWESFGQIFNAFYRWGSTSGKPILVGEYGVLENEPGQKAAWITQAERQIRVEFPGIRAVVYFDSDHDGFDWAVTTSRSALAAFRAFAADPYFDASPFRQ
jgi:beta-mannanase